MNHIESHSKHPTMPIKRGEYTGKIHVYESRIEVIKSNPLATFNTLEEAYEYLDTYETPLKKYEVTIHYSTYAEYTVEAETEDEAYGKARNMEIDKAQALQNLEVWQDADTIEQVD